MKQHPSAQDNIISVGKAKSVGAAFFLALFFGPLGLFYASISAGLIMLFVVFVMFLVLPVVGIILAWFMCIMWAVAAANAANEKITQQRMHTGR